MYSDLLQGKMLILYQFLKMVPHTLSALPTQVLAVELEDHHSAANSLLMLFLVVVVVVLPMLSLFCIHGKKKCPWKGLHLKNIEHLPF